MHLGHLHSWVLVGQVRSSANAFVLSAGQNLSSTERAIQRVNAPFTALSLGVVAALHELSAILYAQGEEFVLVLRGPTDSPIPSSSAIQEELCRVLTDMCH